jgi:hypothetical protein
MEKVKDLVPFTDGQKPDYVFNGCICYINDGYLSFASIDNPQLPNRKTVFENIFEYYISNKQMIDSVDAGLVKVRRKRNKKDLQNDLSWRYASNVLKFHDDEARKRIISFISEEN